MRTSVDETVKTKCLMCNTYTGCTRHQNYKCKGCKLVFSWAYGCADDMPEHCDGCWLKAHREEA